MSIYVSSRVWRSSPQEGDRLLLMLALADYANDDGVCWPSQNSLAKRCRCSERGIVRMIDHLITEGEIILRRPGGGRGNSAVYQLARYSEIGPLAAFGDVTAPVERVTLKPLKDDPGANKGGRLPSQSAVEPKRSTKEPSARRAGSKLSDDEFIEALKSNPAYSHINFTREIGKMDAWLMLPRNKGRKRTRSFVLNWLNKIEGPMATGGAAERDSSADKPVPPEFRSWAAEAYPEKGEETSLYRLWKDVPTYLRDEWNRERKRRPNK